MAKKLATLEDIEYLLNKADRALKKTKADARKPKVCVRCKEGKPGYRNMCENCLTEAKNVRLDERVGKRWFSTNGYEYCNNEEGKPILYATHRMTEMLGRPLQKHESVGRIDGDKTNNADHNLILIAKPGINLSELKCECGRHYFITNPGPLLLPLTKDNPSES